MILKYLFPVEKIDVSALGKKIPTAVLPQDLTEDRVLEGEQHSPLCRKSPGPTLQAEVILKFLEERKASQKS